MHPKLRSATPQDSDEILALMIAVIRDTVDENLHAETIQNVTRNLHHWQNSTESCVHLVAESESSIVGVVLVKDYWNMCSLFVATEHHRKGIGRALTLEALEQCRANSPKQGVYLNSSPLAVAFYLAIGFEPRESQQLLPPDVVPMRFRFTETGLSNKVQYELK